MPSLAGATDLLAWVTGVTTHETPPPRRKNVRTVARPEPKARAPKERVERPVVTLPSWRVARPTKPRHCGFTSNGVKVPCKASTEYAVHANGGSRLIGSGCRGHAVRMVNEFRQAGHADAGLERWD
jgi:hypothetical protein